MSNQRLEKQRQFLQNRLSPEGYAGLHLTIGVLVVLLAGWWFGAIAEAKRLVAGAFLFVCSA